MSLVNDNKRDPVSQREQGVHRIFLNRGHLSKTSNNEPVPSVCQINKFGTPKPPHSDVPVTKTTPRFLEFISSLIKKLNILRQPNDQCWLFGT